VLAALEKQSETHAKEGASLLKEKAELLDEVREIKKENEQKILKNKLRETEIKQMAAKV
jgi:hypothetical protein